MKAWPAVLVAVLSILALGLKEWAVVEGGEKPPSWFTYKVGLLLLEGVTWAHRHVTPAPLQAFELAGGFWRSAATYHLVNMGAIQAFNHTRECLCSEAVRDRLPQPPPPHMLHRLMRAGVTAGLFDMHTSHTQSGPVACYRLTLTGWQFHTDKGALSGGVRELTLWANEWLLSAWYHGLTQALASGGGDSSSLSAFEHVHGGQGFWQSLRQDPPRLRLFQGYIAGLSRMLGRFMAPDLLPLLPSPSTRTKTKTGDGKETPSDSATTICDIGGGRGSFLIELLLADPTLKGVIVELPEVVEEATASLLADPTLQHLDIKLVVGDFLSVGGLSPVLQGTQCDVMLLKHVLHDWPDQECVQILSNVRAAMTNESQLWVVEFVMEEGVRDWEVHEASHSPTDLTMMLLFTHAQERGRAAFESLMSQAGGLALTQVLPTRSPVSLLVTKPTPIST